MGGRARPQATDLQGDRADRPAACAALHGPRLGQGLWRGRRRRVEQAGSRNRRRHGAAGAACMTTRCGFVAVIGAPNAGKSTLVNALVGQKVAIVSAKAQTTRARLMGIAIEGDAQILLLDTPGIFEPRRRLDRAMVAAAWAGAEDADLVLLVVDAAAKLGDRVEAMLAGLETRTQPLMIVLNKVDIARKEVLLNLAAQLSERLKPQALLMVSATSGDGVADLKRALAEATPEAPWHFPADQLSDATDRMVAAELTREQIYRQL